MSASDFIATISACVALAAVGSSFYIARRQTAENRRAQLFSVVDLLDELRQPSYRAVLTYIEDRLAKENPPSEEGHALPPETWNLVRPVIGYFNHIGALVYSGTLDPALVSSVMGGSVQRAWHELAPHIYRERTRRGGDSVYYGYFEHLAAVLTDLGPHVLANQLKLRKLPPSPGEA